MAIVVSVIVLTPGFNFHMVVKVEREALDDNQEQVLENDKRQQRSVSNHEEELGLIKTKTRFHMCTIKHNKSSHCN